jgi:hypothetical protein
VTRREMTAILKEFEDDEQNGVWRSTALTRCIRTTATCWKPRATSTSPA